MINEGRVVTIKKQWVWINGEKFEILDRLDRITLADSFLKNKVGRGSGEAKLYVGQENSFNVFFDDMDREFFFIKDDLISYMYDVKDEFFNPQQNYKKKDEMPQLFEKYISYIKSYNNHFLMFSMERIDVAPPRVYLKSDSEYYDLMREIGLPNISLLSIFKIKNGDGVIYYYMRIFIEDKLNNKKIRSTISDFEIEEDTLKQLCASLNAGQNIILNGVPGTGKTHLATKFAEEAMGENGFILGKFLQAIRENKWLIIDEINRADIDKAFGQLFTVLSGHDVELPYEDVEGNPIKTVMNKNFNRNQYIDGTYYIGKNWRIIGTMNSYDKNTLFDLSYAFMRRFMFVEIEVPNSFDFAAEFKNENNENDKIDNNYYEKLEKLFKINTSSDIKAKYKINRKLGPAIFLDIFTYIDSRSKLSGNSLDYNSEILGDAINAYVIPQFEGLGKKIKNVKKFFESEIFNEEIDKKGWALVKNKLEDLEPKRFKN